MSDNLWDEINEVRNSFFPRWDTKGKWRVIVKGPNELVGPSHWGMSLEKIGGICDPKTRTIQINSAWIERGDDPRLLLIHEICHAVASCSHGGIWQSRLLKVAVKAKELGQLNLASAIEREVEGYREGEHITAQLIHSRISDGVRDEPDASFDAIIKWVTEDIPYTPQEFLRRYPSAEKAFVRPKKSMAVGLLASLKLRARGRPATVPPTPVRPSDFNPSA